VSKHNSVNKETGKPGAASVSSNSIWKKKVIAVKRGGQLWGCIRWNKWCDFSDL